MKGLLRNGEDDYLGIVWDAAIAGIIAGEVVVQRGQVATVLKLDDGFHRQQREQERIADTVGVGIGGYADLIRIRDGEQVNQQLSLIHISEPTRRS